MKKKKEKKKSLAQELKEIYEDFLRFGFTSDQSFQLLLALLKR